MARFFVRRLELPEIVDLFVQVERLDAAILEEEKMAALTSKNAGSKKRKAGQKLDDAERVSAGRFTDFFCAEQHRWAVLFDLRLQYRLLFPECSGTKKWFTTSTTRTFTEGV